MSNNLPGPHEPPPLSAPVDWPAPPRAEVYGAEEESGGGGNPFSRYLSALLRYKWLILLVTVAGTGLGAVASRFVKPEYTTQATLWVEVSNRGGSESGPIQTGQLLQSTAWIELLRSYTVLDYVVEQQHLYIETEPESDLRAFSAFELKDRFRPGSYRVNVDATGKTFELTSAEGVVIEKGNVGGPVGDAVGFAWTPTSRQLRPGRTLSFTVANPRDVAVDLSARIRPGMADKEGNFLRISFAGTDPERTAATLNAVTARYVEVAGNLKRARLDELTAILEEQRLYAEENLRQAEMALENFRVNTITLPSDDASPVAPGLQITRDPVFDSYFQMKVQAEQMRQDQEAIARVLRGIQESTVSVEALALIPAVSASAALTQALAERTENRAQLRALLQRYTDDHVDVRAARQAVETLERETIPRLASGLTAELAGQQAQLEERIGSASVDLRQIPTRSIEEARLQRQVAIAENLHTTLKQRYEETRLAAASSIPDIRVLDEAKVPFKPTTDSRTMLLLLGFVGSLGLSVLGVIVLDRFDPRFRYPEQVTHQMGLPILSAVPFVRNLESQGDDQAAHLAESFRELRLSVMNAHGAAGPLTLTITSPESGDGKSFVAANLAVAFGEQGHRTLLIDGDIRRGTLHRILRRQRTPGLTDLLSQSVTLQDAVQETAMPSVFFIAAGTRMPNGPELLSSSAMSDLIARIRQHFSVILLDSAPLGAGVDPYALATMTRDVMLVLRTGATNRTFTEAKLQLMSRLPVRVLGAVLNGTPPTEAYRYYSYLSGYQVEDELTLQAQNE
jgi:capsular exopolysaccharide synthesis family protein